MRASISLLDRIASIRRLRPIPFLAVAVLISALGMDSAAASGTPTPTADHGHDHGHGRGADEGDRAPTAAERAAADALVAAAREGTTRFADPAVAEAEGYVPITPWAHPHPAA